MATAARAIIIEDGKILVMHRDKYGSKYVTLPGGRLNNNETPEQAVVREIKEETGLDVISAQPVFIEDHPEPYNLQHIFYCRVAPHPPIEVGYDSEEGQMNQVGLNIHTPDWVELGAFGTLAFRTPTLQQAIVTALKQGFPNQPIRL